MLREEQECGGGARGLIMCRQGKKIRPALDFHGRDSFASISNVSFLRPSAQEAAHMLLSLLVSYLALCHRHECEAIALEQGTRYAGKKHSFGVCVVDRRTSVAFVRPECDVTGDVDQWIVSCFTCAP